MVIGILAIPFLVVWGILTLFLPQRNQWMSIPLAVAIVGGLLWGEVNYFAPMRAAAKEKAKAAAQRHEYNRR